MINFVRKYFRIFFEISLLLTVIGFIIGGIIIGWYFGDLTNVDKIFLSIIVGALGLLLGLYFIIVVGGLIATFLNIDENIQKLLHSNDENVVMRENTNQNKYPFLSEENKPGEKMSKEKIDKSLKRDEYVKNNFNNPYVVIMDTVLKNQPDVNANVITDLYCDEIVDFIFDAYDDNNINDVWYKVKYKNYEGWCLRTSIKKVEGNLSSGTNNRTTSDRVILPDSSNGSALGRYKVNVAALGIYKEPDIKSDHIINLLRNEIVVIKQMGEKITEKNSWVLVKDTSGNKGWCHSENLGEVV